MRELRRSAKACPEAFRSLRSILSSARPLPTKGFGEFARGLLVDLKEQYTSFYGCQLSDCGLGTLAEHLPPRVQWWFHLQFFGCDGITDAGIAKLATGLPQSLLHFALAFRKCAEISDVGIEALSKALPEKLEHLKLWFQDAKGVTETGVLLLLGRLPRSIKELGLEFHGTSASGDLQHVTHSNLKEWQQTLKSTGA